MLDSILFCFGSFSEILKSTNLSGTGSITGLIETNTDFEIFYVMEIACNEGAESLEF